MAVKKKQNKFQTMYKRITQIYTIQKELRNKLIFKWEKKRNRKNIFMKI